MMNYTGCTGSSAAINWLRNTEININQPRIGFCVCISTSFALVFLIVLNSETIAKSYRFISGWFLTLLPWFFGCVTHFWCNASSPAVSFRFQMPFRTWFLVQLSSAYLCLSIYYKEGQTHSGFFGLRELRVYLGIIPESPGLKCPTLRWWRWESDQRQTGFFVAAAIIFLLSPWVQIPDSSHHLEGGYFSLNLSLCVYFEYFSLTL